MKQAKVWDQDQPEVSTKDQLQERQHHYSVATRLQVELVEDSEEASEVVLEAESEEEFQAESALSVITIWAILATSPSMDLDQVLEAVVLEAMVLELSEDIMVAMEVMNETWRESRKDQQS